VGAKPPRHSLISFPPSQEDHDSTSEDEKSRGVELSRLGVTVDLELDDIQTVSMAREKSPLLLPPTMSDGQLV
jgi:hypothetical protein